jgi:transglutaminase-like putative cysteine protease
MSIVERPLCRRLNILKRISPRVDGTGWIALGVLFFALATFPAFAKGDSVPDWVHDAAAQKLPQYPAETNAVVLLDQRTYTVDADGRAVKHVRRVVKILRPQGRDEGVIHIDYDKDMKILSMNVWSIAPDGHEYTMKDKDFTDEGFGAGDLIFADDRYRVAHAPGSDPGGVIAYEYERRERPYMNEVTWEFQGELPHLNESFTLDLPAGYSFNTVWAHHADSAPIDLENRRWRWEMNNTAAVDLEHVPLSPSPASLAGRMTVHYGPLGIGSASTWQNIGQWYAPLIKDRMEAAPDVAAKAQQLTAGKTDFYDRAEAIGEFVQKQVRYFAIEMGIGGYQPHAAADIFHHLYGDCKDKATLTSAMLSAVGIHAELMMVDSERGVVDPAAPSLVGNHMIAAIEIPKGYDSPRLHSIVTVHGSRYLIFDPTSEHTPFGQLEHDLQGGYGILMDGAGTQAVLLPVLDPALNTIRRTASFKLGGDGVLSGTVTEKRFGDGSDYRREIFAAGDAKEQRDLIDHALQHDFTTFNATDVKAANADSLNQDFTLSYGLSAGNYARSMGALLMVRPRVLGSLAPDTDHKARTVPIDLGETMQATDEYSIELPAGYAVDEVPDPVKLDLGFAAYESATDVKGNTLHYKRTYTIRQVTLPADRYADVQKLASAIAADEDSRAVLKRQ